MKPISSVLLTRGLAVWAMLLALAVGGSPAIAQTAAEGARKPQPATVPAAASGIAHPLVDFGFGFNDVAPADQVRLLTRLGYQGIVLPDADLKIVNEFAELDAVKNGAFRVYALLWWVNLDKPLDLERLDSFLVPLAKSNAALWIVIDGPKNQQEKVVDYLRQAADHCRARKVQMVLYPHGGAAFEDAEEAMAIWQKLDRKEVRLSIHLCHELLHGNADRISKIIPKVAPLLVLASVNGAELGQDNSTWDWLIMPLDKGSYDPREYLRALIQNGYKGPMVLHTYGIKDPQEDLLKRSMAKWNQLMAELGQKNGK